MATGYQFVSVRRCPITGNRSALHPFHLVGASLRTQSTSKCVVLTDYPVPVSASLNVFKFRESADGESNNLHSAQPELLLQLLQVLKIAFHETNGRGFEAGFQFVGQTTYSNNSRCFDKAIEPPNGNLRIPSVENFGNSRYINDLSAYDSRTLLLQLLFALVSQDRHTFAILDYLASAELAEEDVWLRDDIRIAWITVLYAANDHPSPWEWAFNRVVGGHPSKVIPILVERRQKHAELALPPRKPVTQPEISLAKKAGA